MKDKKQFYIIVTPDNKKEFLDIHRVAYNYIENKMNVPFSLVASLYQIMYEESDYQFHLHWKEAQRQAAIAMQKIKALRGYQFRWKDRSITEHNYIFKPDTKHIFAELIYAFSQYNEDYAAAGRDEVIAFAYMAFDEEYKGMMKPKDRKYFTPYKQAIVSGILATAMGFRLTGKTNPSNAEIFEATRNAIKKYKTREDLFSKFLSTEKV
jgi:hypothetical protein